ncbi:glycosyltransferase family 9 protein [Brachyspira hyodysenteriae]|uniref:RfaF, ADP-heptose:LPS heptosyltransferase n=2 Tax=Brachyspira hyodysenteriae TaxID=159 RepID=A0A3B6VID0_BRAHW|nr:glycosyltransferase family 9 protein [Brachyspira hyodysenteriae]ACN83726.1 RfaF, ADP-heptose:LPS heptosyltransferase [Brachyspira hyodysenteriae WA1]ANN64156.1 heptosyltransferase [Brachyspira hyodysenteriae ATCC 27164]AUJ49460.1 heptosyltransferase [Brachyspira hyodysenteriae]KLI14337.1 heptosyltransferase [Brachyspira hyodysenteriae]KLI15268.1 heptosyltransferase [Brachyspira hyodysenteriae]
MKNINNLLIHSPNWLGDIIMSMPAIYLIKEKYKDIKITVMTKKSMAGIFAAGDLVDECIELRNFPRLRKYNFDAVLIFPNSFESAFRVFGHGIKMRIGYKADYRNFMLTEAVDRKEVRWIHTSDYYVNLLKAIGIDEKRPTFKLKIKEDILNKAKEYLKTVNPENKKIFAYGIGATNSIGKIWKEEYFAEVANYLSNKYDALTLFITTPNEKEISDKISAMLLKDPIIPYMSLDMIAAILSLCDGFIGNDSGAMHVASIVGIPTLALYFATPAGRNYPIGINSHAIEKNVDNPACICGGKKCKLQTFECREVIKPQEVINKFEGIINGL